jgi:hypothetical protein
MAEVRTGMATVERLAGAKGVGIDEVQTSASGNDFHLHMTVWLAENHGLQVGDRARFWGRLSTKTREYNGKTYVDVNLNDGQVLAGTLERKAQTEDATAGAWATATPGEAADWSAAHE